ncbi:sulfite exporter TauE/SafE family protein [Acetilactobacillus jinshanensis]|uniref:Probable membrane transporter protein n=1 Tax=Acetilactobacillus jinshanensis TaxID=1720083 RepID=A0A4P6ZML9_9LACO|nr:sulfite exporter TauE/SafE family protein [Acetilactobacillus jinshanensis]QBP18978.1 sulfite exporter TauE/SafE family protein [Acetilactobacillus jinshanensis]URL61955.1 sulfite exporter TauE/SafE family protein [uncultured bacterium]
MFIPIGILSGIVSATVGLASLVSYPALQAVLPPVAANVTNTTALICTGIGSGVGSLKELKGHWWQVTKIFAITFVGAIIGSLLLLQFSNQAFARIAPFFILMAGILILCPKPHNSASQPTSKVMKWLAVFAMFLVGIYSGYFAAASGILMLALLSYTTDESFPVYNAIRNVAMLSANVIAIIIFIVYHAGIYWPVVFPLGIGLLIGSYCGPAIVRRVPERILKLVVAVAAVMMSIYLFIKAY